MRTWLPLVLALIPALASADHFVTHDYQPNPSFHAVRLRDEGALPGRVAQVGEIAILEGDDDLVSSDGMGNFALELWGLGGNQLEITKRFFTRYADELDEIVVFTTFDDSGTPGAAAYEISTQQDVRGIGQELFDDTEEWGSTNHRLHAFVDMMRWDNYEAYGQTLEDPSNYLYSTLGQEFAHRWLSFFHYVDATGAVSQGMLGRDAAHWASTLQAFASVMDGNQFSELGDDGYYTILDSNSRYSPLDLYGMGLIDASEVEPFFLLENAVTSTGKAVDPTKYLRASAKVKGDREDITIEQILAAEGPRDPAPADSPHDFRVAFVLVTRPGEPADSDSVVQAARRLDVARKVWEERFSSMTGGKGTMCTQISAPCGAAVARIQGGSVVEVEGNHNQVPEPGEPVMITFELLNDSPAAAANVQVTASGNVAAGATPVVLASLAPSATAQATFSGAIPADAVCGQVLTIDGDAVVDGHHFRGFVRVTPGLTDLVQQPFEADDGGLTVSGEAQNGWQWGTPVTYGSTSGFVYQPSSGHDSEKAWFTGLQLGHRGEGDSSLGVGQSVLVTRPIDVSTTYQPALRYFAWYEAIDLSNPEQGGKTRSDLALTVEGTVDGGQTWVPLDSVTGAVSGWQERNVPLDGLIALTGPLRLRFTVANDVATTSVEAGIDDLELRTLTQACDPSYVPPAPAPPETAPQGCACALGDGHGTNPSAALVLCGLLALALVLARRRDI